MAVFSSEPNKQLNLCVRVFSDGRVSHDLHKDAKTIEDDAIPGVREWVDIMGRNGCMGTRYNGSKWAMYGDAV